MPQNREQLDIFGYPSRPGWKGTSTSEAAASAMRRSAGSLRERALCVLGRGYGATADEVAESLGESAFTIRPRVAELFKLGQVEDTGQRRRNASGKFAIVWRAK